MNYLFSYSGPVNFKVKRQLLRNIKSNTEAVAKSVVAQKRVRYVFDEIISNVYEYYKQHNLDGETTTVNGFLKPNHTLEFELNSVVSENDKESLKNLIDSINALNEQELKNLYKKKIKENNADVANAGIGLISIRLKTQTPIVYEFKQNKNQHSILLKIALNLNNE